MGAPISGQSKATLPPPCNRMPVREHPPRRSSSRLAQPAEDVPTVTPWSGGSSTGVVGRFRFASPFRPGRGFVLSWRSARALARSFGISCSMLSRVSCAAGECLLAARDDDRRRTPVVEWLQPGV